MAWTFDFEFAPFHRTKTTFADPISAVAFALGGLEPTTHYWHDKGDRPLAELLADPAVVAQAEDYKRVSSVTYPTAEERDAAASAYFARWDKAGRLARAKAARDEHFAREAA